MITSFQGKYRFLSNFWPIKVTMDDVTYPTVEHAYQAAKTLSEAERFKIRNAATPGLAKKFGRNVTKRANWDKIKISLMTALLRQKFQQSQLKSWLLETSPEILVEGNTWGDRFWGVCFGTGENHLGKILMRIRDELQSQPLNPYPRVWLRCIDPGTPNECWVVCARTDPGAVSFLREDEA